MSARKGFGFGERFGRGEEDRPRQPEPLTIRRDENGIITVLYCPYRCPRCGARHPKHKGSGRGRLPLHYLVCKDCGQEYRAQEVDQESLEQFVRVRMFSSAEHTP